MIAFQHDGRDRIRGHWPTIVMAIVVAGAALAAFVANGLEGIGVVGSAASLISFVLTVYIAVSLNALRRRYVRHIMFKECSSRLIALSKNLQAQVTKKNFDAVRSQLGRAKAILDRIEHHECSGKWSVDSLAGAMESTDEDLVMQVRTCVPLIHERIEMLELLATELDWGRGDDQ